MSTVLATTPFPILIDTIRHTRSDGLERENQTLPDNELSRLISEAMPAAVVWSMPIGDPTGQKLDTYVAEQMQR